MSERERDEYPLGLVCLDRNGVILSFNQTAQRFVNRSAADAVGRHYFREVAPCSSVKEFEGRFLDFLHSPGDRNESFSFFYPFATGHKQVMISMLKSAADENTIYIVTEITAIP